MTEDTPPTQTARTGLSTAVAVLLIAGIWFGVGLASAAVLNDAADYEGTVSLSGPGGTPEVVLTGSGRVDLEDFTQASDSLRIRTTNGNLTANGTGAARLDSITGTWTNTTNLSVDGASLKLDPEDKQAVTVAGKTDSLNFSAMVVNDGDPDFVYEGPSGDTSITIESGLPANVSLAAVDSAGQQLDSSDTDANGTITFVLPNSKHTISIQSQNASQIAPLFPNVSTNPDFGNWTNGSQNASLDTLADYAGRLPGLTIGGQGGVGATGALLLGLVVTGIVTVGTSSVAAGPVTGATAGIAVIAVLTAIGLAPQWLYAVVLFGLGAVGTTVVVRAWS